MAFLGKRSYFGKLEPNLFANLCKFGENSDDMTFAPIDVFEQIINKEIPADIVIETNTVLAFRDINPKAKVHILIIPKKNFVTLKEIRRDNIDQFGKLFLVAKQVAEMENLDGYKLYMSVDEEGGQVVPHVHLHLLSADFKTCL